MVQGEYSKYNQAVTQKEAITPQINSTQEQIQDTEKKINKDLKTAVLTNQKYNISKAQKTKQQITKAKNQLNSYQTSIQKKSTLITPQELEKQGYKKEIQGDKTIYYKENKYRKSNNHNKRTYREEEYIFSNNNQPIKFVKRDTYRDGDKKRLYEEEITEFQNGLIAKHREYRNDEKQQIEQYDNKGRVQYIKKYNSNGKEKEGEFFSYNQDGTYTIETKDYEKNRSQIRKSKKIVNTYDVYNNKTGITTKRKLYADGHYEDKLKDVETHKIKINKDKKTGKITEKYFSKQGNLIKEIEQTPIVKKTPVKKYDIYETKNQTKLKGETLFEQINKNGAKKQKEIEKIFKPQIKQTQFQKQNQQQTSTISQIEELKNPTSQKGKEITFSLHQEKGKVNLNPIRLVVAPVELGMTIGDMAYNIGAFIGDYAAETIITKGQKVKNDYKKIKKGYNSTKKFIDDEGWMAAGGVALSATSTIGLGVMEGTVNAAVEDPLGFVSESLAGGSVEQAAKRTILQKTTSINPIELNSKKIQFEKNKQIVELGEIKGIYEVQNKKGNQIIEIKAQSEINKQQKYQGVMDPEFYIQKNNQISQQILPTEFSKGKVKVISQGKSKEFEIFSIRQQNKQLSKIDKELYYTQTNKINNLNGDDIFSSRTENINTGEGKISYSKKINSKQTKSPTQIQISASQDQTNIFYDRSKSSKKYSDIIQENSKLSQQQKIKLTKQNKVHTKEINIENYKNEINFEDYPKQSKTIDDFNSLTQTLEKTKTKTKTLTKQKNQRVESYNSKFSTEQFSTEIPISEKMIFDTIYSQKLKFKTIPSYKQIQQTKSTQKQISSNSFEFQNPTKQITEKKTTKEQIKINQTKNQFDYDYTPKFSFENPTKTKTPTQPKNNPTAPIPQPKIEFDNNMKTSFDFDYKPKTKIKTNSKSNQKLKDDGQYIGSLGGALLDLTSTNPTKDITGLKIRAIKKTKKNNLF